MNESEPLSLDTATDRDIGAWVASSRDSPGLTHAVYVLNCTPPPSVRDFRIESLVEHTEEKVANGEPLSDRENAARALTRGGSVYYVGYTSEVIDRVRRHAVGAAAGGADFTNLFKPRHLVEIRWFPTESAARKHEPKIATEFASHDEDYAYWN